jgi:nicotinate-nucleotide pyrophosphorylase (carboxylating)
MNSPLSSSVSDDFLKILLAGISEDLKDGDVTAAALPIRGTRARGRLLCKRRGVAAGISLLPALERLSFPGCTAGSLRVSGTVTDGTAMEPGQVVAVVEGCAADLLVIERTMLNLVSPMCGIATLTAQFVALVSGTAAAICDTRKTTPGLRSLQKYAVRCGGGSTHRQGLFDQAMIKENHLQLSRMSITNAVARVRESIGERRLTCEVENLEQLREVLGTDVDCILCDDFSITELEQAVIIRDASGRDVSLEASGGVNLDNVGAIARTGVDRISIGAITHSAPALDLSFKIFAAE